MRTILSLWLACALCAGARTDVIGRATVTASVAFVRANDQLIALVKKGTVLDVLRVEGDTYWVRCAAGEGAVPAYLVRFEALAPPEEDQTRPRPTPRAAEQHFVVVEGNRFLRPLANPQWQWRPVQIGRKNSQPVGVPAAGAARWQQCEILDVSVAADGSAMFLARTEPAGLAVFRSQNGGATFQELGGVYWPIEVARSNPRVLYGLWRGGLFRSDDGGAAWRTVCADLHLPAEPPRADLGPEVSLPFAARTAAILADPFDADRLYLGLRRAPAPAAFASKVVYHGGATGAGAPAEWRFCPDGGKTWSHRLYRGSTAGRLAETAGPTTLPYRPRPIGQATVPVPDVPQDAFLPMGELWFSPRARGVMYWADSPPPAGSDEAARAALHAWLQAGRGAAQPWQGVMRSTDEGKAWRQVGLEAAEAGLPGKADHAFVSFPFVRPGAYENRDALYAVLTCVDEQSGTGRFVVYRYDRGRWEGRELFTLRTADIPLPQPLALLVDATHERVYIPLDRPASGASKALRGGQAAPAYLGGVLFSPDGGDTWRLYNAREADGEFFGPDRAGVLYVRQTKPGGAVLASFVPGAAGGAPASVLLPAGP